MSRDAISTAETTSDTLQDSTSDSTGKTACGPTEETTPKPTEDAPSDPSGNTITTDHAGAAETGTKRPMTADLSGGLNVTSVPAVDPPRKRTRVQAAASRLLPISSGASESCSEVLHRMNQDHVSYQV